MRAQGSERADALSLLSLVVGCSLNCERAYQEPIGIDLRRVVVHQFTARWYAPPLRSKCPARELATRTSPR